MDGEGLYETCPLDIPEVDALRNAQPADMIEMDETQEAIYTATFGQAQEALENVQDITEGRPLTHMDVGQFAHLLHERGLRQQDKIVQFAKSIAKFYDDILCGDYKMHLSKVECMVCLDACVAAAECSNVACGRGMCAECFVDRVESCRGHGWAGVSDVVDLRCGGCDGNLDKRLLKLLPSRGMELYLLAVSECAAATTRREQVVAAKTGDRRKHAAHREDNLTFKDKLYHLERECIGDLVGNFCPDCAAPWYHFEACCQLTCNACGAFFCALCGQGGEGWSKEQVSSHVQRCGNGVEGFQEGFLPFAMWEKHNQLRQWRLCRNYLCKTDLPTSVKERLQSDFPRPRD